jgi:hypothetical protein
MAAAPSSSAFEADVEEIALPSISLPDQVFDVQFHPHQDYVATACITGQVNVFAYSPQGHRSVLELSYHMGSCRALQFTPDGACMCFDQSNNGHSVI